MKGSYSLRRISLFKTITLEREAKALFVPSIFISTGESNKAFLQQLYGLFLIKPQWKLPTLEKG